MGEAMNDSRRRNDRIRTGRTIPGAVLHAALVVVAAVGAVLLVPIIGWQIAVVSAALLGVLLPQSLGGWLSIACIAIGMLMAEPGIWQAMVAVVLVHVLHVLSSLLPVVPWRGKVVVRALWPTARRLLFVQTIAQPLTLAAMLISRDSGAGVWGVALVGAVAITVFVILFLQQDSRRRPGV